jgi:hypothetical protein
VGKQHCALFTNLVYSYDVNISQYKEIMKVSSTHLKLCMHFDKITRTSNNPKQTKMWNSNCNLSIQCLSHLD